MLAGLPMMQAILKYAEEVQVGSYCVCLYAAIAGLLSDLFVLGAA